MLIVLVVVSVVVHDGVAFGVTVGVYDDGVADRVIDVDVVVGDGDSYGVVVVVGGCGYGVGCGSDTDGGVVDGVGVGGVDMWVVYGVDEVGGGGRIVTGRRRDDCIVQR